MRNRHAGQRQRMGRAFTLIELIVVIVIIGILVAVASVAYSSVVSNSRKKAVEASATQVAKVIAGESAAQQRLLTDTEAVASTLTDFPNTSAAAVHVTDKGTPVDGVLTVEQDGLRIDLTLSPIVGSIPTWVPGSAY